MFARQMFLYGCIAFIRFGCFKINIQSNLWTKATQGRECSLFWGHFAKFNQWKVIDVWPLFTGWSLFWGGL